LSPSTSADGTVFRFKGTANSVNLAGEFNSWSTSSDALTKGADGVWTLTKKLNPGRYAYKFVIDGNNWQADPAATETVDDGYGGKNSLVVVGGSAAATPAAATTASSTISADGTVFRYKGVANSVNLAGEFNSWSTSADALTKGADGVWTLTKKLNPGRYAYKFVIDGSNWQADPAATETVDDGYSGKNSVVVVGDGAPASAVAVAATATGKGSTTVLKPVTGKPRAPETTANGTRFTYAGPARSVSLCGSFNGWSTSADAMQQQDDGTWTLVRKLDAGRHAYKFLIDGSRWTTDEANPSSEEDEFGGRNSVVIVK
jgi:1,4-alpha-glucan branching enzyme